MCSMPGFGSYGRNQYLYSIFPHVPLYTHTPPANIHPKTNEDLPHRSHSLARRITLPYMDMSPKRFFPCFFPSFLLSFFPSFLLSFFPSFLLSFSPSLLLSFLLSFPLDSGLWTLDSPTAGLSKRWTLQTLDSPNARLSKRWTTLQTLDSPNAG